MIEFKFEAIQSRGNNVFELATQEEIDKLGSTAKGSSSHGQFTDDIDLDEVLDKKMISIHTTAVNKNLHITSYTIHYIHVVLQDIDKTLHIKGQMVYIEEWQQMLFLACPIMKDLNHLIWSGLFVNDLR